MITGKTIIGAAPTMIVDRRETDTSPFARFDRLPIRTARSGLRIRKCALEDRLGRALIHVERP